MKRSREAADAHNKSYAVMYRGAKYGTPLPCGRRPASPKILKEAKHMIIRYHDGRTSEAILITRRADALRVAMKGADDIAEFRQINGVWVSEDCEPVTIELAGAQVGPPPAVTFEDCICPPELAARLVAMLYEPDPEAEVDAATMSEAALFAAPVCSMAI
jgi:hypothetical protein